MSGKVKELLLVLSCEGMDVPQVHCQVVQVDVKVLVRLLMVVLHWNHRFGTLALPHSVGSLILASPLELEWRYLAHWG